MKRRYSPHTLAASVLATISAAGIAAIGVPNPSSSHVQLAPPVRSTYAANLSLEPAAERTHALSQAFREQTTQSLEDRATNQAEEGKAKSQEEQKCPKSKSSDTSLNIPDDDLLSERRNPIFKLYEKHAEPEIGNGVVALSAVLNYEGSSVSSYAIKDLQILINSEVLSQEEKQLVARTLYAAATDRTRGYMKDLQEYYDFHLSSREGKLVVINSLDRQLLGMRLLLIASEGADVQVLPRVTQALADNIDYWTRRQREDTDLAQAQGRSPDGLYKQTVRDIADVFGVQRGQTSPAVEALRVARPLTMQELNDAAAPRANINIRYGN